MTFEEMHQFTDDNDIILWSLSEADAREIATQKGIENLTPEELRIIGKCLEDGLGNWAEIMEIAIDEAIAETRGR